MIRYSLYSPNDKVIYPKEFAEVSIRKNTWFIVEGVLPAGEQKRCRLLYYGHGMTYETALKEIERLENQSFRKSIVR